MCYMWTWLCTDHWQCTLEQCQHLHNTTNYMLSIITHGNHNLHVQRALWKSGMASSWNWNAVQNRHTGPTPCTGHYTQYMCTNAQCIHKVNAKHTDTLVVFQYSCAVQLLYSALDYSHCVQLLLAATDRHNSNGCAGDWADTITQA